MIQHIVLFKLAPAVTPEKLEEMIRSTRSQLTKIPEVLSVRAGHNVVPDSEWPYFLSVDVESMDKLAIYRDDPVHIKFVEQVIKPNTTDRMALDFVTG